MSYTITISDVLYDQLAEYAIGFDTPENVIKRLIYAYREKKSQESFVNYLGDLEDDDISLPTHLSPVRANEEGENIHHEEITSAPINKTPPVTDRTQNSDNIELQQALTKNQDKDTFDNAQIHTIYTLSKELYEEIITEEEAKNQLISLSDFTDDQVNGYVNIISKMIMGKCYTIKINAEETEILLQNIFKDFGHEGLVSAISSLNKHIAYQQSFPDNCCEELRDLYETLKQHIQRTA